jgi:heme O synthase-like polyprenyltransferase
LDLPRSLSIAGNDMMASVLYTTGLVCAVCGQNAPFALFLAALPLWPWFAGWTPGWQGHVALGGGILAGLVMSALAGRFMRNGERASFRKLFLFTLLYLPLELGLLAFAWT